MRAMERVALPNTIKVLNDDQALDLFKNTSPNASLLQMKVRQSELRQRALARVRALAHSASAQSRPQNDFIALALSGKQIGFEKIIMMADVILATLNQEQTDGDGKLEHCKSGPRTWPRCLRGGPEPGGVGQPEKQQKLLDWGVGAQGARVRPRPLRGCPRAGDLE